MTYRAIKINVLIQLLTVLLAVLLFVLPAKADWTGAEIGKEIAWEFLHILDWGTTLDISDHPDDYCEVGLARVFIGKNPSRSDVNIYMGLGAILHPVATHIIPQKAEIFGWEFSPRAWWQNVTIGGSGYCVGRNFSLGLRVNY